MTIESAEYATACMGCGCCVNICPTDAIHMEYDEGGFLKPVVNRKDCIECEKCILACPAIHLRKPKNNREHPECYAILAETATRMKSSSGGFFTVMAEHTIAQGGSVFGAVWTEDFQCSIVEATQKNEIAPMRLSKYVQSQTGDTFRNVESRLREGKRVAYFGLPCQIAGLNAFLSARGMKQDKRELLLTVDLVCFCAPSNVVFRKYLDEEYGIENVAAVRFRDKRTRGWSPVSYSVELKNGKTICPEPQDDPYQRAFHGVLARKDVCEQCKYYTFPRQGDFTIGDFWGIEQYSASLVDDRGVSVVLVNNDRANVYLENIKRKFTRCEKVSLECCLHKGNRIGYEARPDHPRKKYFEALLNRKTFRESVERAIEGIYDIGCVCMFNYNIGNNLTNYALYRTLRDMGYFVLMIGNPKNEGVLPFGCEEDRFKRFSINPYEKWAISAVAEDKGELYELAEKCDVFVVASDQLWRGIFLKELCDFSTLDWVGSDKYKISYATSFGLDLFDGSMKDAQRFGFLTNRFQKISVRERSGGRFVKELADKEAEVVLDPVFLCNKNIYEKMIEMGNVNLEKEDYVAAYFLDKTKEKESALLGLSNRLTDGAYYAATDYPEVLLNESKITYKENPSVEEWLAMVKGCQFFLTDSFHGICFALIFQKEFAVIYDEANWRGYARIQEILDKFGLPDRYLKNDGECVDHLLAACGTKIDWEKVSTKLQKERGISYKWLKAAIESGRGYKGTYDLYDEILRTKRALYSQKKQNQKQNNEIRARIARIQSTQFLTSFALRTEEIKKTEMRSKEPVTVVGFGVGNCFRRNLQVIKQVYDLRIMCDNDPGKWEQEIEDGMICIPPMKLKEIQNILVVIMVDDVGISFEIANQLLDMGITRFTHITNWLKAIDS